MLLLHPGGTQSSPRIALSCQVSYFEYLETIFDAASAQHPAERPHWILNCSEAVWMLARDRVYVCHAASCHVP